MRKLFYLMMLIVILGLIIPGCTFHVVPPLGQDGSIDIVKDDVSYKTNLIAGQHTIAGSITVSNDDENLFIIYETVDSWLLNKTHLYIGQTVPTNSAPGQFSYKHENLAGVSTDSYEIPLVDLWVGFSDTVYIAAHAELTKEGQKEGGWAEGAEIRPGKDWAMYFEYQLSWDEFSDYEKIAITTDRAIHEFVANCEIYGEEQAKQMIIDSLLGKEGVINAGIGIDNESIWFQWENGMISSFSEYPELEEQQKGFSRSFDELGILTYSKDARNTPENNKAIIFDWEHTQESTVKVRMIEDFLNDKGYVPTYRSRSESTFTLYELENINDYGVIYIDSHAFADGVHGVKILTGQEGMPFTPEYDEVCAYFKGKYGTDNFISTHSFYKKKWFGLVEEYIGRFYCFYPGFIEAIAKYKSFPKSLAYADACYSYACPSMAAAFTDSGGAYAYCGYSGTTYAECKTDYLTFQYLLVDGMDLEAAIDKAHLNTNLPILCWGLHFYPQDHGDFYLVNGGTGPVHNLTKGTYYTTIQAALDDANSNNTIEVSDGTYGENITFPSGKKIILQSVNGPFSTIIQGNGVNTVILNNTSEGTTLEGFTITNESGNTGRGIYNNGNLIINNCTISNNSFVGHGGGIINIGGVLTITGSTISGNIGYAGGAIYNNENTILTITECTISNNKAAGSQVGSGGGICNNNGTLIITGSTISSNSAQWGGAIWNHGNCILTIKGSTISSNSADYCGGIGYYTGTITIGGSSNTDIGNFNEFTNNYKIGSPPSPDQHIRNNSVDCHMDYPYNYFTPNNNGAYALRDIGPAGGLIFYDKGSYSDGWRYLESAPPIFWIGKNWGPFNTWIGGTETGIGTGQANTTEIVNALGAGSFAAHLCDAHVVENNGVTYSDWFLPSKDELNLMYTNLKVFGVGNFLQGSYWSSSERSSGSAWGQDFRDGYDGYQGNYGKSSDDCVRAVRAF